MSLALNNWALMIFIGRNANRRFHVTIVMLVYVHMMRVNGRGGLCWEYLPYVSRNNASLAFLKSNAISLKF